MNDGFPIQRATPSFFSDPRPRRGRHASRPLRPRDPANSGIQVEDRENRGGELGLGSRVQDRGGKVVARQV